MGDFTDVLAAVPEFGKAYSREQFFNPDSDGAITVFTPVDGSQPIFVSAAVIQTNRGPMQVNFRLAALTLADACEVWQATARIAIEGFGHQLKEQQGRIVLPENAVPFKKKVLS